MPNLRGALLVMGVILQLSGINTAVELEEKEWWETALVYQIWPRAFQDSDGDGEGDLQGIFEQLDYIKNLGVDAIWLNSIYDSPWVDSGYDITDHNSIHPKLLGDDGDIDKLIKEAHEKDLKVILDIVPNHSSIEHLWFNLSQAQVDPYDDFYIWANGCIDESGGKIEPNNWVSFYDSERNGSAWTWNSIREQWYYHKFHYSQPDLNLRNEDVIQKLMETLDFWLEKGVDGFCFTSVSYLFEDEDITNEWYIGEDRNQTKNTKEDIELLYRFREHVDDWVEKNNSTSKLLIASSDDPDENLILYYGNESHAGISPFNYHFLTTVNSTSNAEDIKSMIEEWISYIPGNVATNWPLTNQDHSRTPTRLGLDRMDGFQILTLLLPGQAFTYYGEEISMMDTKISWNETIDPMGFEKSEETYENFSRDPARTPMQWNSNISAGFSTSEDTFLPVNPSFEEINVENQLKVPYSHLNTYKKVAFLRKENPIFTHGSYELECLNDNKVLILMRYLEGSPIYFVVINLESSNETINLLGEYPILEDSFEVTISTDPEIETTKITGPFILSGNKAVVLKGKVFTSENNEFNDSISTTLPYDELTISNSEIPSSLTLPNEKKESIEEANEKATALKENTTEDEEPTTSTSRALQKNIGVIFSAMFFNFINFYFFAQRIFSLI